MKPTEVRVASLCIIFEVKDNDPADVRFEGTRLEVRYRHDGVEHWHGASEQSFKQVFALRNYLASHHLDVPFITNLIWLRQVPNAQLPHRPHNLLGGNPTWELVLNIVGQLDPPHEHDGEWTLEAWRERVQPNFQSIVRLLTLRLQRTRLDNVRMARLVRSALDADWLRDLGVKQLIFRGRGGTGKTMILLQLAWRLYEEKGARVLVLTYNKALMADLRRLLTFVGVGDVAAARSIQVQTAHSFLGSALRELGLLGPDEDLLARYDALKSEGLALIRGGGLKAEDVEKLLRERPEAFGWDFLLIDEGQDWPEDERDLLRFLYPARQFVIADGMDQLVRSESACDWKKGLASNEVQVIALARCLRMKAALAQFANALAEELGFGDYFASRELHDRLMRANEADGNQPVDTLVCVPPALVVREDGRGIRSVPAEKLAGWGHVVWDGVSTEVRDSYATSTQQMRVVQYDSCRGLEGWIVIALGIDEFFRYKDHSWQPASGQETPYGDDPAARSRFASRWLMIPLSRAVDTLVLEVGAGRSRLKEALQHVADRHPDFVEWYKTAGP
jgi:hypothetical protein